MNPYIFGVPLSGRETPFIGRAQVSHQIYQALRTPHNPPLLLYGQRRMGKTSLLRQLPRLLPAGVILLFVDGEVLALSHSFEQFLHSMVWQIGQAAALVGVRLTPPAADPLSLPTFGQWLHQVERELHTAGYQMAVLALDEFEAVDLLLEQERFPAELVLHLLQQLLEERTFFKLLLAGSHTIVNFQQWATYFSEVQMVHLSYLTLEESRKLILRPVPRFALKYEPAACAHLLSLLHGHPYLTQLFCYLLVEMKQEQGSLTPVSLPEVEEMIPAALETAAFFLADFAQQLPPEQLALLQQVAQEPEQSLWELQEQFGDGCLEWVEELLQKEILAPAGSGYRVQVELIGRWLAQPKR